MNTSLNTNSSNPDGHPIKRVPPPILPQLSKEQLKKSKNYQINCMAKDTSRTNPIKSFAQVTALAVNILKIKKTFPALLDKKIIEIYYYKLHSVISLSIL